MSGFTSTSGGHAGSSSADPMSFRAGSRFEDDMLRFAVEAALAATKGGQTRHVPGRGFDAALDVLS